MTPTELQELWNSPELIREAIEERKASIAMLQNRLSQLSAGQDVEPAFVMRADGAVSLKSIPGFWDEVADAEQGDIVDQTWAARFPRWWFTAEAAGDAQKPTAEQKARIILNTSNATMMNGLLGGKGSWGAYDIAPTGDGSFKLTDVGIPDAQSTMADMEREDGTIVSRNFRVAEARTWASKWRAHFRRTSGEAVRRAAKG